MNFSGIIRKFADVHDCIVPKRYTESMAMKLKPRWTRKRLIALGLPGVLIPGILLAITLGWNPAIFTKTNNYHEIKKIFPFSGIAKDVYDGDTFRLSNGVEVRLIGVNAPGRGEKHYKEAREYLSRIIDEKRVYLEYDRYQDDKYGRVLAWIWVNCEKEPTFLPAEYMHLTYNSSREGLTQNPEGCKKGILVNEAIVETGFASSEPYKDRGELKYEKRLQHAP